MRQVGLKAEILVNILFITAVGMLLIGIIAFKVTERFALEGNIEGVKSVIAAFEVFYAKEGDIESGINFLKDTLEPGAWGVISERGQRTAFHTTSANGTANPADPMILEVMNTGRAAIDIDGVNIPPLTFYKGFKIAVPLEKGGRRDGVILLYQPLLSLQENISLGQRLIALSIILNLIVIAVFGFYVLSKRVVEPVHKLIMTTEEISKGRFPENMNLGGVKEINHLHLALKDMYDEIEESKTELGENIAALEESNRALIKTQKELIASEKLASLGRLSAGVAHEIGNPLSAIRGYVEVLSKGYASDEEKRSEFLTNIQTETERIDKIIRTLLEYSRPRDFELKPLDANEVVRRAAGIINSQGILKSIKLDLELHDGLSPVRADPHQLSQVIINLILNAKDAVSSDGEIIVSTAAVSNGEIEIAVKDDGAGIPEEAMDKIFDPFFTTKEIGKGTGLGLSVCERIVQMFGGRILIDSGPGKGTTFRVILPAA